MADRAGMIRMADIRAKYPMYDDVPDAVLLRSLHQKHYADMPERDFMSRIEFAGQTDKVARMGSLARFGEGGAVALENLARGIGQRMGLVSDQDVATARQRDAAIMDTPAGQLGNIATNVGVLAPTALIPGANTMAGAALLGGATGALQPTTADESTLKNAGIGAAAGPAALVAGRLVGAAYQGGRSLLAPFTAAGQERIAADSLQRFAGDAPAAAQALRNPPRLLPGDAPTVAELTQDAGLAQLQRTLTNADPQMGAAMSARNQQQMAARLGAVRGIARDDAARAAAVQARDDVAGGLYRQAMDGFDPANVSPQASAAAADLMMRPSLRDAVQQARWLAQDAGQTLDDAGSLQGMHWTNQALDDAIGTAPQTGIGQARLRSMTGNRNALLTLMDDISPDYALARNVYADMSRPINQMDIGRSLADALQPAMSDFGGITRETGARFTNALRNADQTAARATGFRGAGMADVMTPEQMDTLRLVGESLARKANANELGRAVGSPTAQNLSSEHVLRSLLGPTGLPQGWAESTLLQSLMRPVQFVARSGDERVRQVLSDAMLDPQAAARLLELAQQRGLAQRLGSGVSAYLPLTGAATAAGANGP